MDKSWIQLRRRASPEYIKGVLDFIEFAFSSSADKDGKIVYPRVKCVFTKRVSKSDAVDQYVMAFSKDMFDGFFREKFNESTTTTSTGTTNEEEKELGQKNRDLLQDRKRKRAMDVNAGSAPKAMNVDAGSSPKLELHNGKPERAMNVDADNAPKFSLHDRKPQRAAMNVNTGEGNQSSDSSHQSNENEHDAAA